MREEESAGRREARIRGGKLESHICEPRADVGHPASGMDVRNCKDLGRVFGERLQV
jgi:hypothetical protein